MLDNKEYVIVFIFIIKWKTDDSVAARAKKAKNTQEAERKAIATKQAGYFDNSQFNCAFECSWKEC